VNSLDEVEGIFDEYLRLRHTFAPDVIGGDDSTDADAIETAA
jgi:hypothetical protein